MKARYEMMDLEDNRLDLVCGGNAGDVESDKNSNKAMYDLDQELYAQNIYNPYTRRNFDKNCTIESRVFENGHWNYYISYDYARGCNGYSTAHVWVTADTFRRK